MERGDDRDWSGLLDCVLAALIRRSGGSVTLTRAEVDGALDASQSADGTRSAWLFDFTPTSDGQAVTIRAIASPVSPPAHTV